MSQENSTSKHFEVDIAVIPHRRQRYETVGDYYEVEGKTYLRVSELSDWRREFLVALHEMVEMAWARHWDISNDEIDAFDMDFEARRAEGDTSEPGDDPACPVYTGHQIATLIERAMAFVLEVPWSEYDAEINALSQDET